MEVFDERRRLLSQAVDRSLERAHKEMMRIRFFIQKSACSHSEQCSTGPGQCQHDSSRQRPEPNGRQAVVVTIVGKELIH